ncbi:MAG: putative Ig domain-containing protein [Clostridiaceae bacterium]|nr:putative Ig domain-containing protein [Clostridiaceae bacterium]
MHTVIAPAQPFNEGKPRINLPGVYGASPNKPFLYRLPVTGKPPILFECLSGLPGGLSLNESTGILSGTSPAEGHYPVIIKASNALGSDQKILMLRIAPDGICRTPLLGWTSWNACRGAVSQADIQKTAELLVSSGLAAYGYQHVNIDSGWQGEYGGPHNAIQPNNRFPDMKALADSVHRLGLKLGIYSTPMLKAWGGDTFPGCTTGKLDKAYADVYYGIGSDHREANNVCQWEAWGIDYLKYDWAPCDVKNASLMKECLLNSGRDFAFCVTVAAGIENAEYWKTHCSSWRDNEDSNDVWDNVKKRFLTDRWAVFCSPGHFFDLDMLEIGYFDGRRCRLTEDEQVLAFTIRALFPSPIQISCDLEKLTDFDLALLCNDEVLAVNQDALGNGAVCISERVTRNLDRAVQSEMKIYARLLEDQSYAVGFFNLGETETEMTLRLAAGAKARDLWAKKDITCVRDQLAVALAPHTARLIKIKGKIVE